MNCKLCLLDKFSAAECTHDDNTIFLMAVWLKNRPKSLLEFHICVYHELSLLESDKEISTSLREFVKRYKLYE